VVHAVGREATLYASRAGVDLIFHAYECDDECIEAMLKTGSAIGPTLTLRKNLIEFTQPHEPAALRGRVDATRRDYERVCANLRKAHKAGVPFMAGTDSGFAVTPYGEWHARELEIFVEDLGFTPAEALRSATAINAGFLVERDMIGVLETGRFADFIAVDGSPLQNISILLDKPRIRAVHIAGRKMEIADRPYDPLKVTDLMQVSWTDLYTQDHVAALRRKKAPRRAAE
jgi:imidazolonepropionase-like amidohydrolase